MNTKPKCEFCNKKFSTVGNLKNHLISAKYCLNNRPEPKEQIASQDILIIESDNYECNYCGKSFTQNKSLQLHMRTCKDAKIAKKDEKYKLLEIELEKDKESIYNLEILLENANKVIHDLELELASYKGELKGIKTAKPQTIQKVKNTGSGKIYINPKLENVPTHNIEPLTIDYIKKNLPNYTYDLFLKGPLGVVEFLEPLIRVYDENDPDAKPCRNYVCTDVPRHKYHKYTGLDGVEKWEFDNAASFVNRLLDLLKSQMEVYFLRATIADQYETMQRFEDPNFKLTSLEESESTKMILNVTPMYRGVMETGKARIKLLEEIRPHIAEIVGI